MTREFADIFDAMFYREESDKPSNVVQLPLKDDDEKPESSD